MTSSKFSRRPVVQQPPPVCRSKKIPIIPIVPPPPPWPPLTLNALVHWKEETPPGPPLFDIETSFVLTRVDDGNRYEGDTTAEGHDLILIVDFNGIGPPAAVLTRITKPATYEFTATDDVDIALVQPFAPDTFRLFVVDWEPWMWCDITLTPP